jgi:hypothetical protein
MLATVCPATTLRFDAVGIVAPAGHTVTKLDAVGSVTVRFRATATASAGMPAWPATWSARVSPSASGAAAVPTPARVSMIRVGAMGWNETVAAAAGLAGRATTATRGISNAPASAPARANRRQRAIETSCRRPTRGG